MLVGGKRLRAPRRVRVGPLTLFWYWNRGGEHGRERAPIHARHATGARFVLGPLWIAWRSASRTEDVAPAEGAGSVSNGPGQDTAP
jgi:hypothetical protein